MKEERYNHLHVTEKEGRYLCIHTVMVIILTQRIF